MNFFSKLFNKYADTPTPVIQFGRFTDTYKSESNYAAWDKSIEFFENEKYIQSFVEMMAFLSNDDNDNVSYTNNQGQLKFTLYQGSKLIQGHADHKSFSAEAKIAIMKAKHLGLLRFLLEENYNLKYSRYSLDEDDCIYLKFDTYVEDSSPHKLYQALKELSTVSDRRDDVLMEKFSDLEAVNFYPAREISTHEKQIKYELLKKISGDVIHEFENGKLNTFIYPGGLSFLLLDGLYAIDYMLKPEGKVMEMVHQSHDVFFSDNITLVHDKNKAIIKSYRTIADITLDEFSKELYEVKSTFGLSVPDGHQRLVDIIDAQLNDFEWYYHNKYLHYARAICGYVVGFSLYSYSLPAPSKDLLMLYYRIIYNDFFSSLGYSEIFLKNGDFNKKNIVSHIKKIIQVHQERYGHLKIDEGLLDYSDEFVFCRSYLTMLKNLIYPN